MDDEKPVIAVDGRLALQAERGFEGEYLNRLLTELGFMSRPYVIHVFGDLTADPEMLRRMRFIHPVDLLITPNFFTWEQMAFPQAVHGAAVVQGASLPWFIRRPSIALLFEVPDVAPSAYRRTMARRALSRSHWVVAVSEAVKESLVTGGVPQDRIIVVPPGVKAPNEAIRFSKEPRLVVEKPHQQLLQDALMQAGVDELSLEPLTQGDEDQTRAQLADALAFVTVSRNPRSSWYQLLAEAEGCPVVGPDAALPASNWAEAAAAIQRLTTEPDRLRQIVEQGLQHAQNNSWKKSAEMLDNLYRTALGIEASR
ncbi:glycosyltransferase [Sulfobacillus harzensis]|uniref:Glycosyltransferase family 4 protein n=1 Tax=Sulfobacillus harzensis TaxID=2729629 RepID=A0A7Y0Q280_9FIRM|nr:glycosyltransferase [Sulfobacillus harzensis]NMP22908.1 glycosyltransferase family 4 protein [Sulfobacillus harzensis]